MSRVLVLVEGQTEQTFFHRVLEEHLADRGVFASCTMVCTKREEDRRRHRGGHGRRWKHVERDVRGLLGSNPRAVSTMLDLYGFPEDMPGFPTAWPVSAIARADLLEAALGNAIGDARFVPGVFVHEFEALLFADIDALVSIACAPQHGDTVASRLRSIRSKVATPEDIDREHPPSSRLSEAIASYRKRQHGPLVAEAIGLGSLRNACPVFHRWLTRIEALA